MKRSTWGSVNYDPKSKKGVIRYWASEDERGYMRHSVTVRGSRADVERRRSELMLAHSDEAPCPTVDEMWEAWYLPDRRRMVEAGDLAVASLRQYEGSYRRVVRGRWGSVPADAVRPLEVQRWIDGLTAMQAKMGVIVLRALMDYAVRYEMVSSNPLRNAYIMPSPSTIAVLESGAWSVEELGRLMAECSRTRAGAPVILQGAGGCRVGESLGVLCEDVARAERHGVTCAVVHVHQQVLSGGHELTSRLKNKFSRRHVVVPGDPGRWLLAASEGRDGLLADRADGRPVSQGDLRPAFSGAIERAGVERHPMRALRASWQTTCRWELGMEPWAIERLMGHSDGSVTAEHYDKPDVEQLVEACTLAYSRNPVFDGVGIFRDMTTL